MNCASCHSVRCLSVNQTVMKSFSSPLKRRYHWNDAVRSVTVLALGRHQRPVRLELPLAAQASMQATAAAISSSSGRSMSGTLVGGRSAAQRRSAALDEAAGGQLVVQLHQRLPRRHARCSAGPAAPTPSTGARPPAARRRPGARRRRRRPGSCSSTRNPVRPWSTSVVSPPTAEATTGVPQAAASSATRPKDSERLGTRQTSAAR